VKPHSLDLLSGIPGGATEHDLIMPRDQIQRIRDLN